MRFGPEKELEIFNALASKSTLQVGLAYGFDKVYKDARAVKNAVSAIYNKVKNNPEKYGISQDAVALVQQSMMERRISGAKKEGTLVEKTEFKGDIKELVTTIRDKTFLLIDKKLDRVKNSKKKLDAISFKDLGIIAGISFDKGQILRGEATENIAVMARIDQNLSPAEVLELALKMREESVEKNSGR